MPLLRSTEIPLRATLLMDAPLGAVRRVLRRTDVWTRTVRALGARADIATVGAPAGPRAPLEAGDLIRIRRDGGSSLWPARALILRVDLRAEGADQLPVFDLVAGPLGRCHVGLTAVSTGAGTLVTVDVRVRAAPAVLTPTLRRRVLGTAQVFLGIALLAAREIQIVVAGAVIENGKVLAARRTAPSELAGFWELPGGKVDPTNESIAAAAVRELREETGLDVTEDRVTVFVMLHDVVAGINRVTMGAVVSVQAENPKVTEPHLISTWQWTDLDDLPEPLFDPSAQILAAWRPELPVEHPPAHCLRVTAVPAEADS